MKRYISEFIGTFILVLAGTGAIVVNDFSGGAITHSGIAMVFGLVVMAMIYSLGDLSGAHLNPAVTIAFLSKKDMTLKDSIYYIFFQILGGLSASLFLKATFPTDKTLGMTLPSISPMGAFAFELILTFILMFVILHVATGAKEKGLMAGVAIGATVCLEAMFAGPVTGASMNPARSIAPAIAASNFTHLWIYIVAPIAGALLAVGINSYLTSNE